MRRLCVWQVRRLRSGRDRRSPVEAPPAQPGQRNRPCADRPSKLMRYGAGSQQLRNRVHGSDCSGGRDRRALVAAPCLPDDFRGHRYGPRRESIADRDSEFPDRNRTSLPDEDILRLRTNGAVVSRFMPATRLQALHGGWAAWQISLPLEVRDRQPATAGRRLEGGERVFILHRVNLAPGQCLFNNAGNWSGNERIPVWSTCMSRDVEHELQRPGAQCGGDPARHGHQRDHQAEGGCYLRVPDRVWT